MNGRPYLASFLEKKGYLENTQNKHLAPRDIPKARSALAADRNAYFLNALITLSGIIHLIRKNNYSWAFIQAYYLLYYLAKTYIATNDYSIVYAHKKPYAIQLIPGKKFEKKHGNSHEVVLKLFKTEFSTNIFIRNKIDELTPPDWFKKIREHINYKQNPLTDPLPPFKIFQYKDNLRNWIATYNSDELHVYTFTEEHAFLAYPLQMLNQIFDYYERNNLVNSLIEQSHISFFLDNLSDSKGSIPSIIERIKAVTKTEV